MSMATILIVDDERSLLEVLEIVLTRSGYDVVTAATLEEGERLFGEKSVDLVLILADEKPDQTTDPAFAAHTLPIGYWAQAVWDSWRPRAALADQFGHAHRRLGASQPPPDGPRTPSPQRLRPTS